MLFPTHPHRTATIDQRLRRDKMSFLARPLPLAHIHFNLGAVKYSDPWLSHSIRKVINVDDGIDRRDESRDRGVEGS